MEEPSPVDRLDIKPCPFCGGKADIIERDDSYHPDSRFDIACKTPDCYLEDGGDWWDTEAEVIRRWNERAL